MMRVKDVIPKTSDGSNVTAVMSASTCKDSEYVTSPSRFCSVVRAGRPPRSKDCEKAGVATVSKTRR